MGNKTEGSAGRATGKRTETKGKRTRERDLGKGQSERKINWKWI